MLSSLLIPLNVQIYATHTPLNKPFLQSLTFLPEVFLLSHGSTNPLSFEANYAPESSARSWVPFLAQYNLLRRYVLNHEVSNAQNTVPDSLD